MKDYLGWMLWLLTIVGVLGQPSAAQLAEPMGAVVGREVAQGGTTWPWASKSIDPTGSDRGSLPAAESIGVIPLVASDVAPYFATDSTAVVAVPFNQASTDLGTSAVDAGLDHRFMAQANFVEGVHPIPDVVTVTVTSIDALGQATPWVPAGFTLPGGVLAKFWRFDAGSLEAMIDPLIPSGPFAVRSSRMELHDSFGTLIGSFALGPNDHSTPVSVGGVANAFLPDEFGASLDIAGYDLASMTLIWELDEAIFVDGFETGSLARWQ